MFARESGVSFTSPPLFGNALYYSESDHVSLTTGHLVYLLPMNLNDVTTYDVINKKDKVARNVGKTQDVVFPSVQPEDSLNRFSGHTFRHSSWSPRGGAPNGGCLLAVASTDGRVTVYRPPAVNNNLLAVQRWMEAADIYRLLHDHCVKEEFNNNIIPINRPPSPVRQGKRKVEIVDEISGGEAIRRTYMLETLCIYIPNYFTRLFDELGLCWSPLFPSASSSSKTALSRKKMDVFLVLGGKSKITLWKCNIPIAPPFEYKFKFAHSIDTEGQWVTSIAWKGNRLAAAFADGRVKIWEVEQTGGDVATKMLFKLEPDMVYPSSIVWVDYNLWVVKGHAIVKISEDGKVTRQEAAHKTLAKAMSLCNATKQLITLTEDGGIKAWNPDTFQVMWERESEAGKKNLGWFGIAASPMGRYMIALEQVSGTTDKMYKARNATGKFWTIPSGDTRPLAQVLLEHVKAGYKESIWDLVDFVVREHDPALLLSITSALEEYYYSTTWLPKVRALAIVNILYEKAIYIEDKETLEQIQAKKQKNIMVLVKNHLETVVLQFQQAEKRGGADFALQLTDRELVSLKNMQSWLRLFVPEHTALFAILAPHVDNREVVEKCRFCSKPIPFTSHSEAACEGGHTFVRCTRTLLALSSPVLWHNPFTNTKSLVFDFECEDKAHTPEFLWIIGELTPTTHPRCPIYDVSLLRFAPTLLDKLDRDKLSAMVK